MPVPSAAALKSAINTRLQAMLESRRHYLTHRNRLVDLGVRLSSDSMILQDSYNESMAWCEKSSNSVSVIEKKSMYRWIHSEILKFVSLMIETFIPLLTGLCSEYTGDHFLTWKERVARIYSASDVFNRASMGSARTPSKN